MVALTQQTAFWAGGLGAYRQQRQRELAERLAPLRQKLKTETDKEARKQIKAEIKHIGKEFAAKEKASRYLLFGKR